AARFADLQARLAPLWRSIRELTDDEQTIVVVPSLSVDVVLPGALQQAMEERFLFLLLLLRQPRARLVYVTSQRISPSVVEYYLDLLPGVLSSHARRRLHLLAPEDGSSGPLSAKLLERPRLLAQIRALIPDPHRAHLVPYATTAMERDLALELGIPLYGADPRHLPFGTKTGGRRLFAEEGVPHPLGAEGLRSLADIVEAIRALRARRPGLGQAIVKLNEGVSGLGNASVDLAALPAPGSADEGPAIEAAVREMSFESENAKWTKYLGKVEEDGAVVEERLVGDEFRSPSVQLRVTPLGDVELLSTHDQLLGGPSGQAYLGCVFPADPAYAALISREAMKIGRRLAREGVLGRFALDFVTVRERGGAWRVYAIEINLRKGGTTHPFLTLQFLTDGRYDPETSVFTAPSGRAKHFVASDHVESPDYRAFTPDDLFDVLVRRRLHFDQSRQTGVVLHMLAAVAERGRFGLTAVADSAAEAQALYERSIAILDEEAQSALRR
ncbi:MAG TPA: peptide ligase PGM1-related protein, partial [Thermoanaerobaculia bacterium]|nr:peptide ligase PGM1-related protein [Thermoanaerobaculia bacterium]